MRAPLRYTELSSRQQVASAHEGSVCDSYISCFACSSSSLFCQSTFLGFLSVLKIFYRFISAHHWWESVLLLTNWQLPPMLLKECKALQNISLHENPISMEQFQQARSFNPLKSMISFFLKFIFLFLSSCFYFPSAHTFFPPPFLADGRISRIWSSEEEEVWQGDWLKRDDKLSRAWRGHWLLTVSCTVFRVKK